MEEKVLTEDEIKLLELIEFIDIFYQQGVFVNKAMKGELSRHVKENKMIKEDVIEYAHDRHGMKMDDIEDEKQRWLEANSEVCEHCEKFDDYIPTGEVIKDNGKAFYTFTCKYCGKESVSDCFNGSLGELDWYERVHNELYLTDEHGNLIGDASKTKLAKFEESKKYIDELKKDILEWDEFEKEIKEDDELQSIQIKMKIEQLTYVKKYIFEPIGML